MRSGQPWALRQRKTRRREAEAEPRRQGKKKKPFPIRSERAWSSPQKPGLEPVNDVRGQRNGVAIIHTERLVGGQ